uniref:Translation initiation factor eIF2B subunit delta n=1 Tax=Trypanosoma congolense (strain IL3000) TaxID=1068625 RepID=G0UZF4_TRYCI|nr:unnamed protein product [Trypanosoma congolense IL3000]
MENLKEEVGRLEGTCNPQQGGTNPSAGASPRRREAVPPSSGSHPVRSARTYATPGSTGSRTPRHVCFPHSRENASHRSSPARKRTVPCKAAGEVTKGAVGAACTAVVCEKSGASVCNDKASADLSAQIQGCIDNSIAASVHVALWRRQNNDHEVVHYQVAELALMMESMIVVGGNARTFAMIEAFSSLLKSSAKLSGPSINDLTPQCFENLIKVNFNFLCRSRAPSAGMTNVKDSLVRRVVALLSQGQKARFSADDVFGSPRSARRERSTSVSTTSFSRDRIETSFYETSPRDMALRVLSAIEKELQLSIKSIVEDRSASHLSSNDTILVFGRSSTVELILLSAANNPRLIVKPKVIVVDSAPLYEGRALATRLSCSGLNVTYGLITACCTLMPRCTRVFIGAAAVLQNGDVFSRCGTAVVVSSAKQFRKPVLCFSESIKFVPEVWLGNLGQNAKLADMRQPHNSELRMCSPSQWNSVPHGGCDSLDGMKCRTQINTTDATNEKVDEEATRLLQMDTPSSSGYLYDLTPAAYIDMIICEMGCLHTSAILAALRDREDRDLYLMSAT